jgi:hypothetical protein
LLAVERRFEGRQRRGVIAVSILVAARLVGIGVTGGPTTDGLALAVIAALLTVGTPGVRVSRRWRFRSR